MAVIVTEVHRHNFRRADDVVVPFDRGLTVLVGENGTGKSDTALVVNRTAEGSVHDEDRRFERNDAVVSVALAMNEEDLRPSLAAVLTDGVDPQAAQQVRSWVLSQGALNLMVGHGTPPRMQWGGSHSKTPSCLPEMCAKGMSSVGNRGQQQPTGSGGCRIWPARARATCDFPHLPSKPSRPPCAAHSTTSPISDSRIASRRALLLLTPSTEPTRPALS